MGQSASSSQPKPVLKIDTADKFQRQFNYWIRHGCLTELERPRLRKAFESFSSKSGSNTEETGPDHPSEAASEGQLSWDKQELVDFLSATIPVELKADLDVAGALLFKAMLRLGSFPFHNWQTPSRLGVDAASLAIIFLLRKHEDVTGFTLDNDEDDDSDDHDHEQTQQLRDRWFHRLLFQIMSNKPDLDRQQHGLQEQDKFSVRDPADDEHLIQVRELLMAYNTGRDENRPKVLIRFPPVIEVSELPSSRSRDFTGTIPKEEFQALLNVLSGITNNPSVNVSQFVEAPGIDWQGFQAILSKLEPHISSGLYQLFEPFIDGSVVD
ncbi:hypothetical protein F4779DRAFT_170499 [Xylariaceae sp. FL0662B]|nr:hypothetical protein F4779DRAFT_170499 [Xylariaceae sp. FL0662B]